MRNRIALWLATAAAKITADLSSRVTLESAADGLRIICFHQADINRWRGSMRPHDPLK